MTKNEINCNQKQSSKQYLKFTRSRKFILTIGLIVLSTVILLLNINRINIFTQLFKQWLSFLLLVFSIYTGGNVGSKVISKITGNNNNRQEK